MKYRIGKKEDIPQILALAKKHGIPPPNLNNCFVAEQNGNIIGYANGGQVNYIDSFVAENSIAGLYLMAMLEGVVAAQGLPTSFAGTINDKAGDLLLRLGYEEVKNTRFFVKKG